MKAIFSIFGVLNACERRQDRLLYGLVGTSTHADRVYWFPVPQHSSSGAGRTELG